MIDPTKGIKKAMEQAQEKKQLQRWRDFVEILFLAFVLALFLRTFFVGFYRVSTGSMAPNLRVGDFVWVSKIAYGVRIPFTKVRVWERLPERGDLVLFRRPDDSTTVHIKRVIGLPGDHIHIRDQQIMVNDAPFRLDAMGSMAFADIAGAEFMRFFREFNGGMDYPVMFSDKIGGKKEIGPLVVPPGGIFVIGDNRDASDDSRYWGSIPMTHVDGEMKGIWFSLQWVLEGKSPASRIRWDRINFDF